MTTRHIGIREFRDGATRHIASGDVLAIERHGALVGYFVPVTSRDRRETVEDAVERLRAESSEDVLTDLRSRRDEIVAVCARHGASDVRIFGSAARGEATASSDVDFLVDIEPGRSLLDLAGLLNDLEDLLGRSVDVCTERMLRPYVRESVLVDAQPL